MAAKITFFPVGNGDMTLIALADSDKTTLLIDMHTRASADDPDDDTPDVAKQLRERIQRDAKKRPYVDACLLSHPDKDHCTGLENHFYLGAPEDYPDDDKPDNEKRIIIRRMWSSPMVFRRANKKEGFALCSDAKAWGKEARRRVQVNRDKKFTDVQDGDKILILGEDEDGKTDDLGAILVKVDETFHGFDDAKSAYFSARLLAPMPKEDDETEKVLSKNNSSVILNMTIAASGTVTDGCRFLSGGDAEVAIWEKLWGRNKKTPDVFAYDLLQAPHHCSWHSLSYDSWKDKRDKGVVNADARNALSQANGGAFIVASSDPIKDDDIDPPCFGAKKEYEKIVYADNVKGEFYCTGEYPNANDPAPLEFTIGGQGPQAPAKKESGTKAASILTTTRTPHEHG